MAGIIPSQQPSLIVIKESPDSNMKPRLAALLVVIPFGVPASAQTETPKPNPDAY
jgi:hypothetical protein